MKNKWLLAIALILGISLSLFSMNSYSMILNKRGVNATYPLAAQIDYIFYEIGEKQRNEFQGIEFPTIVGYLKFDKDNKAILEITSEYNFEGLENFFEKVNEAGKFVLSWKCGGGEVSRDDENFLSAIDCHLDANGINPMGLILGDPSTRKYSFKETRKFDINDPKTFRAVSSILNNVIREIIE